ncbi:MAG: Holliday junction branch migration DNA helicase RuvB [Fibrobacterota bacterium]
MKERIVMPEEWGDERDFESSVRPRSFDDFIGQKKNKENLQVYIKAAHGRKEAMDHVILHGPPGLGKTTLAHIIAAELGVGIKSTSGPALTKKGELTGILTDLQKGDVLFIDEIHSLNRTLEEYLYSAMEDFKLDIIIESGPGARSITLDIKPFTLVGATTRWGLLSPPLRGRFGIQVHLDHYEAQDLAEIVMRSSKKLSVGIDPVSANEIGSRSRGTPRLANRYLRRARDFAQVDGKDAIDRAIVMKTLDRLEVDPLGLDRLDKRILGALIEKFRGGPVGLNTLAIAVSEDPDTLEEVYEPFLIMKGLLKRTSRGREATELAYRHLGLKNPNSTGDSPSLFT